MNNCVFDVDRPLCKSNRTQHHTVVFVRLFICFSENHQLIYFRIEFTNGRNSRVNFIVSRLVAVSGCVQTFNWNASVWPAGKRTRGKNTRNMHEIKMKYIACYTKHKRFRFNSIPLNIIWAETLWKLYVFAVRTKHPVGRVCLRVFSFYVLGRDVMLIISIVSYVYGNFFCFRICDAIPIFAVRQHDRNYE